MVATDAIGGAGGMGILWNTREVNLGDLRASIFISTTPFHILGSSVRGAISNVHGPSNAAIKSTFLENLLWLERTMGVSH